MTERKFLYLLLVSLVAVGQSAHIARRDASFQDSDEDNEIGWNGSHGDDQMAEEDQDDFQPYSGPNQDYPNADGEFGDKDGNFPGIFDGEEDEGDRDEVPDGQSDEDDEDRLPGPFGGGGDSFFSNPFLNLKQVREYFRELEKALERTFRQTLEEAKLLNGTYANTTEEEVVIGGKKYLVQKSIIKGGDNNSAIYVETLASKSKEDGSINGMEVKKESEINGTTSH